MISFGVVMEIMQLQQRSNIHKPRTQENSLTIQLVPDSVHEYDSYCFPLVFFVEPG